MSGKADSIVMELARKDEIDAQTLLTTYCRRLYEQYGSIEEVSRHIRLDRRTVKKYLQTVKKETKNITPAS